MRVRDLPIKSKVVAVVMLTTLAALLLTTAVFVIHDAVNFRGMMVRNLQTTASIIAENSSGSLAFQNEKDARQVLAALHAEPHIRLAAIYDTEGNVYAQYPEQTSVGEFPLKPGPNGPRFEKGRLVLFEPIAEGEKRYGTLFLASDLRALSARVRLFVGIALALLAASTVLALLISNMLQRHITEPVLALAGTARQVSEGGDYSVRARQTSGDELGALTDAFNLMLQRIQDQTLALRDREEQLRLALEASRTGTWDYHIREKRIVWDRYLHNLFGLEPGAFSGSYQEFLDRIHEEDRDAVASRISDAIENKTEFNAEYRILWPDRSVRWLVSRGKAIYDERGNPLRMNGVALDITTRKQAEEMRSFLAALVHSSDDAVIGKDLKGCVISWNAAAERIFGYRAEEMIGKSIQAIIAPDRPHEEEEIIREVKEGRTRHFETVRIRKGGQPVDVSIAVSPVKDESGRIIGISSIARDISESKRGREAMARLAAIVESSEDAIISGDLNGIITSWNRGATRLYGYSAQEVIGKPLTILLPADRKEEEESMLVRIRRGERIDHYETLRQRKDGTLLEVSLTISPLKDAQGTIIGASKIARDISDYKQARAALERQATTLREQAQMLDLANVLARDLHNRIILWNSGMEKLYGWNKSEALGKTTHQLFRTEFSTPLPEIEAILFKEGHWEGELSHFRKDGQRITVTSQWVLHRNKEGQPAAILEVNNDITERKKAEAEITRINAELEHRVQVRTAELTAANKELEAFTYSVAHDLRAPLRHIDAFTRILHEDYGATLPADANHYLHNIRQGSRNMSQLVDDLLNLARVGRQELKRQPTPLDGLVHEVMSDLKRETSDRQIEWRVAPLPTVECDPGLMRQVFTNLLSNAVKYTRPRPVAVIEVGATRVNGDSALFVRDNGVGFSMKYADKLFGVFQRLHRAEEFEGTGVGLATVERIVRKHGGAIWADAAVDKGAAFYFTVPGLQLPN